MATLTKKKTVKKPSIKRRDDSDYYDRAVIQPAKRLVAVLTGNKNGDKPTSR
jgi:hypothetical protein